MIRIQGNKYVNQVTNSLKKNRIKTFEHIK